MKTRSKRYRACIKEYDTLNNYPLMDAVKVVKKFQSAKFDESVELNFQLGIRPEQSDEMVRGTASLPHGTGKKIRVLCFAQGEPAKAAEQAGADYVGADDYVQKVESGWMDFDAIVATPDMMRTISRLGKVLGPRGLMPTPKTGTVTMDVAKAIKEIKAGRVEFKSDKTGGLHVSCGKKSFEEDAIFENAKVVIKAVLDAKPAAAKGDYIKSLSISTSQGPGVRVKSTATNVIEQ